MGEGGELDVLTDSDGECVFVRITDTGKGIAARDLDSIFEPYYTTKNEGTGLGLVIVDRIIRDHGAELHVDSQPGKGTRFTIRFPLRNKRTRMLEAPELEIPLTPVEVKEEDE